MIRVFFQYLAGLALALTGASAAERRAPVRPSEIDVDAMLYAIAQVETGDNNARVGRAGERSAWQIMEGTWRMHTRAKHSLASTSRSLARDVATRHLDYLMETLRRTHASCAPEMLAAAWRHGPGLARTFANSDYARRVANLYRQDVAREKLNRRLTAHQ